MTAPAKRLAGDPSRQVYVVELIASAGEPHYEDDLLAYGICVLDAENGAGGYRMLPEIYGTRSQAYTAAAELGGVLV